MEVTELIKLVGHLTSFCKDTPFDKKESYADLVTEVDKAVENFILKVCILPCLVFRIIAEEAYSGNAQLTCSPTWIIDPIDGTSNFVSRYVSHAFDLFSGYQGAFLNDKQIHTSKLKGECSLFLFILLFWMDYKSSKVRFYYIKYYHHKIRLLFVRIGGIFSSSFYHFGTYLKNNLSVHSSIFSYVIF
ncbi:unnamed protein product [Trichobilharzia regenti]|nr:unnamed protein product [Trichobilharzia regenti]